MLTSNTPRLDLHGEVTSMVPYLVNEFINNSYKIGLDLVVIVHGKSTNILTKEVHSVLKKNKLVKNFKKNNWNLGETIVFLNK